MTVATYPAYDGSPDASAWTYGLGAALNAGGFYRGGFGELTNVRWITATMPLNLQPGTYYLTEVGVMCGKTDVDDLGDVRFAIYESTGAALTPVAFDDGTTYIDMTAEKTVQDSSSAKVGPTTVASVPFTIVTGKTYHLVWALQGLANRSNGTPGFMFMTDGHGPQGLTLYINDGLQANATFPAAFTGEVSDTGECPRGYIKFTTPVRKLLSTAYTTAADLLIPYRTDGTFCIKYQAAVVADGQAFQSVMHYENASSDATRTTLVLDFGATDQVTFGGASVALAAAGAEAGDTIDMLAEFRASSKADLFWTNRTTGQGPEGVGDFATFSHKVRATTTRAAEYSIDKPAYLKNTGTAAVAAIQVGWEPLVLFGDSQLSIPSSRLGFHLPTAFTHPRIFWESWISGNTMTDGVGGGSQSPGYLRYKSTTAGNGDLCEMKGCVFVFGGFGVNDLSGIGTTEANRNKIVALLATRYCEILDDLQDRAIPTLIIGLPPYSTATNASEQEAQTIKTQFNPLLEGLAIGVRAAYCNPWHAMVQGGTAADAVPTFLYEYTFEGNEATKGLHYNTTGAAIVASMAARALETGIVGGWWSRNRRLQRQNGSLFPI